MGQANSTMESLEYRQWHGKRNWWSVRRRRLANRRPKRDAIAPTSLQRKIGNAGRVMASSSG